MFKLLFIFFFFDEFVLYYTTLYTYIIYFELYYSIFVKFCKYKFH